MIIWGFCKIELNFQDESSFLLRNESLVWISDSEKSTYNILDVINSRFEIVEERDGFTNAYFDHFKKLYSRHWYPVTKTDDFYLSKYFKFVSFFNYILKNQKHSKVVFSNLPHEGPDFILYVLAKELGLETFVFFQTLIPSVSFISTTLSHKDRVLSFVKDESIEFKVDKLLNTIGKWFYIKKASSGLFIFNQFKNVKRNLILKLIYLPVLLKDILSMKLEIQNIPVAVDFSNNYVYFPLHLQPEMTTDALGGIFSDQFEAILKLRDMLPENIFIYVKENPKQTPHRRKNFYDKLARLKNVRLVPNNLNSLDVIKTSIGVATITGTAGFEAASLGKPVIVFGDAWYLGLPNTYELELWDDFYNRVNAASFEEVKFKAIELFEKYGFSIVSDQAYSKEINLYDPNKNAKEIVKIINKL